MRRVEPPGAERLDPTRDLFLEVRFSEALFTDAQSAITRSDNLNTLLDAIALQVSF